MSRKNWKLEVGVGAGMNGTRLGPIVVAQVRDVGNLDLAGGRGNGRS